MFLNQTYMPQSCPPSTMSVVVVHSVPFTTYVVSSNPAHVGVYSMQHYVIKFVSDLRQVVGSLCILRFPPLIELT
jgi:hypothetical protein